jgi:hypothetical protein
MVVDHPWSTLDLITLAGKNDKPMILPFLNQHAFPTGLIYLLYRNKMDPRIRVILE